MTESIEKKLSAWLSSFSALPRVNSEFLPKRNGELSLRIKKGPETVRRYVFGGAVLRCEFALRVRVSDYDANTRGRGPEILYTAGQIIESSLSALDGICGCFSGITEYPSMVQRTDNGDCEYEGVFYMVYTEGCK
jgi:hypothetical protein